MQNSQLKIILYIFLLFLVACHPSLPVINELRIASNMIEEHPDTALYLLDKIAEPEKLQDNEYAIYCLLKTQVEDMNGIIHTSDSLINVAIEYFGNSEDSYLKAKSFYYLARVQEDLGNPDLAESYYLTALATYEKLNDFSNSAYIYEKLSQFYFNLERYEEAFTTQKKSYYNQLLIVSNKPDKRWQVVVAGVILVSFLLGTSFRYRSRFIKKEKQIGKQERQLHAARATISEQKTELNSLKNQLKVLSKNKYESSEIVKKLQEIKVLSIVSKNKPSLTEIEWDKFLSILEETYGFISNLKQAYPKLTEIDIRICALIKEGIKSDHISSILNITPDALIRRMHRIKSEKMNCSNRQTTLRAILADI